MDKELIAMCDTPEIQEKWKPKVGDNFYYGGNMYPKKGHIVEQLIPLNEDIGVSPIGETGYWELGLTDDLVFLPRIEDVLEWLDGQEFPIKMMHEGLWQIHDIQDRPIKAILKAYMYLRHNKTWNGEAWV